MRETKSLRIQGNRWSKFSNLHEKQEILEAERGNRIAKMGEKDERAREFKEACDGQRALQLEHFREVLRLKEESVSLNKERKVLREKAEEAALRKKIANEELRFKDFIERKEELKKQRVKALFDAERSKNDLREAFMQMNVWNAWNTAMVDRMLYQAMKEEDPHHTGKTIAERVREDASRQHSRSRRRRRHLSTEAHEEAGAREEGEGWRSSRGQSRGKLSTLSSGEEEKK